MTLNNLEVEILLVEDSEKDIELTLHALRAENLGNQIHVARDGEESPAVPGGPGERTRSRERCIAKADSARFEVAESRWLAGAPADQDQSGNPVHSGGCADLLQGRRRYGSQLPVGGKQLPAKTGEVRAVPKIGEGYGAVLAPYQPAAVCGSLEEKGSRGLREAVPEQACAKEP